MDALVMAENPREVIDYKENGQKLNKHWDNDSKLQRIAHLPTGLLPRNNYTLIEAHSIRTIQFPK